MLLWITEARNLQLNVLKEFSSLTSFFMLLWPFSRYWAAFHIWILSAMFLSKKNSSLHWMFSPYLSFQKVSISSLIGVVFTLVFILPEKVVEFLALSYKNFVLVVLILPIYWHFCLSYSITRSTFSFLSILYLLNNRFLFFIFLFLSLSVSATADSAH